MAIEARARLSPRTVDTGEPAAPAAFAFGALILAAYGLGAVALAGEAAVHIQQYEAVLHGVRGIGPLFLLNAAASIAAIAGLVFRPTRRLAALTGVATSAIALAALVVSYGRGLYGWFETGFRAPVEVAVIAELSAVIFLSVALAATLLERSVPSCPPAGVGAAEPRSAPTSERTRSAKT
jgi:hypothetical protein